MVCHQADASEQAARHSRIIDALAAAHDAAVQMIESSIVHVLENSP